MRRAARDRHSARRAERPIPRLPTPPRRDREKEDKRGLRRRFDPREQVERSPAPTRRRSPASYSFSSCRPRACVETVRSFQRLAPRVGTEHFHADGPARQLFERLLGAPVVEVPLEVDEEQVAGFWATQRERFDPAEIQLVPLERLQSV